ncbi:MAG: hypothetical protein N4A72_14905 [Bacteroidales bacterium]|jgi:hypothetical protein|nr:hypothetical protein [Bacteroidales bacterium]
MNLDTLKSKLNNREFFKSACPGRFLFWSFWKKSHEKYTTFPVKEVCKGTSLREFTYEDRIYNVIAYSTNGDIQPDILEEIKTFVNRVEIGQIRYESHGTNGFFPLTSPEGEVRNGEDSLSAIFKKVDNTFIIVVTESGTNPVKVKSSQIAHIRNGKEIWHWSILDTNI